MAALAASSAGGRVTPCGQRRAAAPEGLFAEGLTRDSRRLPHLLRRPPAEQGARGGRTPRGPARELRTHKPRRELPPEERGSSRGAGFCCTGRARGAA